MVMTMVEQLADSLGLSVADLDGFAQSRYGTRVWSPELALAVRMDLDGPHCVRSVPGVWWPGSDPQAGSAATKMR